MCCKTKDCCRRHCAEWARPTVWPLLGIMTAGFTIFSLVAYSVLSVVFERFTHMYSTGFWMIFFFFSFYILIAVTVYAPFQQQLFPLWYKILSVIWYVGYSLFLGIVWSYFNDWYKDWESSWEEVMGEYFTPYSLIYMSTGFVWAWLIPHLYVVFGITCGFQVIQHIAKDRFQWYHWLCASLAGTISLFIFFLVKKKNFCKQWPWCTSAKVAENKNAKWCCEAWVYRNLCRCCQRNKFREKSLTDGDLSFRVVTAVKAQIFLFYLKSFPAFVKIFGKTACIPFLVASPWIDFLIVQLSLLILILPWIDPNVLTIPKYVFLHSMMAFLIGIMECLSGLYRINAYLGEEQTYFVTDCFQVDIGGMWYVVFGIFGTAVCCFVQWYYSMKLFVSLNHALDNSDICSAYFSEWKRESIYPLLTLIGIICSVITLLVISVISLEDRGNEDELVWQCCCVGFLFFYTLSIICVYSPYQKQLYHWGWRAFTNIFIPILFLAVIRSNQSNSIAFWYLFFVTFALFLSWNVPLNIGLFAIIWPFQFCLYFADLQRLIGGDRNDNDIELNTLQLIYGIIGSFTLVIVHLIWNLCVNKSVNIFKGNKFPIIQARNIDRVDDKEAMCQCCYIPSFCGNQQCCDCLKCEEFWHGRLCFCVSEIEKGANGIELWIKTTDETEQTNFIEMDHLLDSIIKNRETHSEQTDTQHQLTKLLNLIESNKETQKHALQHLLDINKIQIDGDEKKRDSEFQRKLVFDTSTLEVRLPNFNDLVYTPSNLTELMQKMQTAVNNGQKIKAMGSRYAFGNVTFTDGLLIDMYNSINDPNMNINTKSLNDYGKQIYDEHNLKLCQSGAQFQALQEILWPPNMRHTTTDPQTGLPYKALRDVGGYDQLSVGGLMNVGGAGEGVPFKNAETTGSLMNQILAYSLIIIDDSGKVRLVQVEPSQDNGCIHDRERWKQEFPQIELIQNDDMFEAGLVGVGLLGVAYSYYVQVGDAYFVKEKRHLMTLEKFKNSEWAKVKQDILDNKVEAIEVYLSPYKVFGGKFSKSQPVLIETFSKTDEKPPEKVTVKTGGGTENPGWLIRGGAVVNDWLTRTVPELIPFTTKLQLLALDHDDIVRPCMVMGSAGYRALSVPTRTTAYGFIYSDDRFFQFIDDYTEMMNQMRKDDKNQVHPMPVSIRFSSHPCKGLLNFLNGNREDCYFWIEFIVPHFDKVATVKNVNDILHRVGEFATSAPYFGNPHWGMHYIFPQKDKEHNSFKNIDKEKLDKFVKMYQKYNKTKTFCNQFTEQSGLDKIAEMV